MSETTDLAAAVQAAHDKVTDMCSGSGRWTMSIPVRLDHDHGVVITRALTMQADALAAARREVETAQAESRLRGETIDALRKEVAGWEERTKHLGSVVLRAWEVLRKWWQWSKLEDRDEPFADALARAIAEDASHDAYALSEMRRLNEEAERQAGVICNLNTALAASRAALEDVRRVEKWLAKDFQLGRYVKTTGSGKLVAIEEDPDMAVVAISLEALGRALAQEAGDAK